MLYNVFQSGPMLHVCLTHQMHAGIFFFFEIIMINCNHSCKFTRILLLKNEIGFTRNKSFGFNRYQMLYSSQVLCSMFAHQVQEILKALLENRHPPNKQTIPGLYPVIE